MQKNDDQENKQVTLSNTVTLIVQDFLPQEDSPPTMSTVNCCHILGMAPLRTAVVGFKKYKQC